MKITRKVLRMVKVQAWANAWILAQPLKRHKGSSKTWWRSKTKINVSIVAAGGVQKVFETSEGRWRPRKVLDVINLKAYIKYVFPARICAAQLLQPWTKVGKVFEQRALGPIYASSLSAAKFMLTKYIFIIFSVFWVGGMRYEGLFWEGLLFRGKCIECHFGGEYWWPHYGSKIRWESVFQWNR